jgi:hypothetical protein
MRQIRGAAAFLVVLLVGCDFFGGGPEPTPRPPEIRSFTANPAVITTPGQDVTLSWQLSGAVTSLTLDPGGVAVSGSSTTVNPTQTTTYTLTARNSAGESSAQTTVTLDDGTAPEPPGQDTTPPTGNFAVGPTANGPFTNDRAENITGPNDERVVQVEPGDSFFAQVSYSDPSGIAAIEVNLVNSNPPGIAGTLVQGQSISGFTLVGPVNTGCDLQNRPTSITCVYQIDVGDDVVNIDRLAGSAGEFAYVFRTRVTDAAGNTSNEPIRGYVVVGEAATSPTLPEEPTPPQPEPPTPEPPAPPEEPTPPQPEPPTPEPPGEDLIASFTASPNPAPAGASITFTWELSEDAPAGGTLVLTADQDVLASDEIVLTGSSYTLEDGIDQETTFTLSLLDEAEVLDEATVTVTLTE